MTGEQASWIVAECALLFCFFIKQTALNLNTECLATPPLIWNLFKNLILTWRCRFRFIARPNKSGSRRQHSWCINVLWNHHNELQLELSYTVELSYRIELQPPKLSERVICYMLSTQRHQPHVTQTIHMTSARPYTDRRCSSPSVVEQSPGSDSLSL